MVIKKRALFYLSNHSDNICSVKFYDENNLISSCSCGIVTLWDLNDKKSVGNYKVSDYSALYSNTFDKEHFYVKTKEGSVKLWNVKYNKCILKINANNFTYAKPYSVHNALVTPINQNGDIAIYDINVKQNCVLACNGMDQYRGDDNCCKDVPLSGRSSNSGISNEGKCENMKSEIYNNRIIYNTTCNNFYSSKCKELIIPFKEIKKKMDNIEIICNLENKNECKKMLSNNLKLCKDIIDIYPLPYFGDTFIIACYEPSLFCIYDYRMTNNFISSFIIDIKENVLSYHVNNNNCLISTNNNVMYYLTFDKNQKVQLKKVAPSYHSANNIVIRPDDKIFISITNNTTINVCNLYDINIIDQIVSYKFNYFNFLDFHTFSGFFAAAEKNKISLWTNQASNFSPIQK
ncbi:conserved Plasmodium protein, unknown function [Plasmodium malariae]|uniref:Uncharacterized protein n=1 Tax=Plasmodium malariae TaxID=5858 RepID=A0A1D3SMA8_PLAMA|nr:conserved Plasmodium protein, unknown function [Plasmodium malariae]SCO92964.1 conserved Plasmodium protein, unknown function [Plasmodium malariae]